MKNELKIEPVPAAVNFAAALGIEKNREGQLCDLIEKCYDDTDTYPRALECISLSVDTVHELAYAIFHLGAFAGNEAARKEIMQSLHKH